MVAGFELSDVTGRSKAGHELVVEFFDNESSIRGLIGIHSTSLGPALGGIRARTYSSHDQALNDVLLLSEAMTLKASAAGLNLGGGGAVIELEGQGRPDAAQWERFGELVEGFSGRFVAFGDAGVGQDDIEMIGRETCHVVGTVGGLGDPPSWVARGVKAAMEGALLAVDGAVEWNTRTIVLVGVGKVGGVLAQMLSDAEAEVKVADIDIEAAKELSVMSGVEVVDIDWAHEIGCDILAPCALGGYINGRTAPAIGARMIIGAASNQLAENSLAEVLAANGVIYIPDFVANAGGLMCVDAERRLGELEDLEAKITELGGNVHRLVRLALSQSVTPLELVTGQARTRVAAGIVE